MIKHYEMIKINIQQIKYILFDKFVILFFL